MAKYFLEWFDDEINEAIEDAGKKALAMAGADLQQVSSDEAPVDLGDLRGDASVDKSRLDSDQEIAVGYGLPYALRQHEELDYSHPMGGKAKFLEDPFNANANKYLGFIRDEMGKAIA